MKQTFTDLLKNRTNDLYDKFIQMLYKPIKKDKGKEIPHYVNTEEGQNQQADLCFLPTDKEYQYVLVVVEQSKPRICDAVALKTKKCIEIKQAFNTIYNEHKILKIPKQLTIDGGSEFKADCSKYLKDILKIDVRITKPKRHRQNALVEYKNKIIGELIYKYNNTLELKTNDVSSKWTEELPHIIEAINDYVKEKDIKQEDNELILPANQNDILEEGMKVLIPLDEARSLKGFELANSKIRAADIKWNPEIYTIERVIMFPNLPILYAVNNKLKVGYTRNQIQIIEPEMLKFLEKIQDEKESVHHWEVEKIIDRKQTKDKKIFYRIKWLGFPVKESTWEPRDELIKTIPKMIKNFDKSYK